MMDWRKEGTFGRGAPHRNPSARTQIFAAARRTSHGSKKEETSAEVVNIQVFIVPW